MQTRLLRMRTEPNETIQYYLRGESGDELHFNTLLGNEIQLHFKGEITCIECNKSIRKTYQGMCYPCFSTSPRAAECIIRPELCRAHLGEGRDPEWEEQNHNQAHVVYLALSGGLKVGVTRATQVPARWIDQGASQTIVLAQTPYRQLAGAIEMEIKQFISDKTDWRKMLRNESPDVDILEQKEELAELLSSALLPFVSDDHKVHDWQYPVLEYPTKVSSVSLDKQPLIEGVLAGIRGQYLIFDGGKVMNIRNHSGYHVQIKL